MFQISEDSYEERIGQIYGSLLEIHKMNEFSEDSIENCKQYFPDTAKLTMDNLRDAKQKIVSFKKDLAVIWDCLLAEITEKGVISSRETNLNEIDPDFGTWFIKLSEDPIMNENNSGKPNSKLSKSIIKAMKSLDIAIEATKSASNLADSMQKKRTEFYTEEKKRKPQRISNKCVCQFEEKIIQNLRDMSIKPYYSQENGHIVTLSLNSTSIIPEELWKTLSKLKNLTELSISNNKNLSTLPDSIIEIESLKKLTLVGNKLTELPKSIENLPNLTYLDVHRN